jgi:hypothetical protein
MRHPRSTPLRLGLWAALAIAPVGLLACDLIIESRTVQCETDADCSKFSGATCDTQNKVCVGGPGGTGGSTSSSGSPPCQVDGGCYACAPTTNDQFLNACTDAKCTAFDRSRLTKLVDGGLPPIP